MLSPANNTLLGQGIKLMYVVDSLASKGGVERVLTDKMNYFVQNGFSVVVVTYEQGDHPFSFALNSQIRHIDTNTRFFTLYRHGLLRRIIERKRMIKNYRNKLQSIVDTEQPDVILITTYGLPICGEVAYLKTNAKLIAEAHIPQKETIEGNRHSASLIRKLYDKWNNYYQCSKVRHFDVVVSLTKGDLVSWTKYAKKVVVIPNPVTRFPDSLPIAKYRYHRILAVGRLHKQKGFDLLIKAFSQIANKCIDWKLDIFGSGDEKDNLQSLINDYNLQGQVTIHEATSSIYDEYLSSDFLVLSSRYEGFCLVLLEALSCGLPCVAFRCKYGPEEIIVDGKNGLLAKDNDIEDLADKMLWMCEHSDDCSGNMRLAARESVLRYRKDVVMPSWIELFDSLCPTR